MALTRASGASFSQAARLHSISAALLPAAARRAVAAVAATILAIALLLPASEARATSSDNANAVAARLALLPPLVGAAEGLRRHEHAGVALEGFDPVTYFLADRPRSGEATHEAIWNGHAWRFASAANRAAFLSRPDVYAPRLGGHDALAMTDGRLVEAQARIAAIVSGRLYLFHSRAARDAFLDDPHAAARAERVWAESRERLARL